MNDSPLSAPYGLCPLCHESWPDVSEDSETIVYQCEQCQTQLEIESKETRFVRYLPNDHEILWIFKFGVFVSVQYVFPVEMTATQKADSFFLVIPHWDLIPFDTSPEQLQMKGTSALFARVAKHLPSFSSSNWSA